MDERNGIDQRKGMNERKGMDVKGGSYGLKGGMERKEDWRKEERRE